jgi:hypothetical protein
VGILSALKKLGSQPDKQLLRIVSLVQAVTLEREAMIRTLFDCPKHSHKHSDMKQSIRDPI